MIATWMLSALLFTALLGVSAFCAESVLRAVGRQTRWPWLVALGGSVVWPALAPIVRRLIPETGAMRSVATTMPSIQVVPDQLPAVSWTHWVDVALLTMWAITSAIVLTRLGYSLVVLSRIRRASQPQVVDGVSVFVSASVGPAVVGIVQPSVLFPAALLELDAPLRRLVLRHEQEHCRARDPWIVVGSAFALALVPWNAPLWWIVRRARLALEVDCDARVLATEPNKTQYGKLLMLISQRQQTTVLAPMLAASSSHLERRIAAMLPIRSNRRGVRVVVALVATVVAGIAACTSRIGDGIVGPKPVIADRAANVNPDQPYFEFQVTKQVQQVPGTGNLRYPDLLRSANVQGVVLGQFIVDEQGVFEPGTFKELKSDHALFTQAVLTALPNMRFSPAELRGVRVKQLVQQPFTFSLSRNEAISPRPASAALVTVVGTVAHRAAVGGPPSPDKPHLESQVTKAASQIPGTGNIRYPDLLRHANVEGEVLATFVVDTSGAYLPGSLMVLKSSHELFTEAVKNALPNMRFTPAEVQGKRVRQVMQQPFTFSLSK
ncbi:MAG: M56 family metallopeptidase [bacterium]